MTIAAQIDDIQDAGEVEEAGGSHPLFTDAPRSVSFNKLRKRLLRNVRQAFDDFGMLKGQKRWLVGLSGGKDSYGLLALLLDLKWRGLLPVELIACNLDQGQPNFPKHILPDYLTKIGMPHRIEYRDTYSIVKERSLRVRPIARSVRVFAVAISIVSHAKRAATRCFWAITAKTFWRPSS